MESKARFAGLSENGVHWTKIVTVHVQIFEPAFEIYLCLEVKAKVEFEG
mgnify:CR=1 FL=1